MSRFRRSRRRADLAVTVDSALTGTELNEATLNESETADAERAVLAPNEQLLAVPPTRRAKTIKRGAHVAMAPVRFTTDFVEGVRLYWRGFGLWGTSPKLLLIGVIPGVLTSILFTAVIGSFFAWGDDVALWTGRQVDEHTIISGFWAAVFAFAVLTGLVLLLVLSFVSVLSVVGQPFFEMISHDVDDRLGTVPDGPGWPWWRNAIRGIGEGLRLFLVQAPISISIFLIGLIPFVGTVTSWILGALFGGWFVALEMTSIPFERRGYVLRDRRRALAGRRARTLGFGVMAFFMAFGPLVVLTMPAGVAAGTVLARRSLGEEVGPLGRRRAVPNRASAPG